MELTTGCIGSLNCSVKDIKHVQKLLFFQYTQYFKLFVKLMLKKRYTQEAWKYTFLLLYHLVSSEILIFI